MLEASRFTFADRNAYLADPDFFDVPLAGLLSDSFAAERRALIDENHAATSPVAPGDPYDNQRQTGKPPHAQRHDQPPAPVHHPPGRLGQQGQRRLLHVHDRVDRRQRDRRARLRLPHEQRADRLQLRLADAPEPRRRRQAPAQLDEPDDHHARRQAVHGGRLAGRLDDPGHGPPGPARAARPRRDAARGDRAPARRHSGTATTDTAEPAFINSPEGQALARATATPYTIDVRDRRGHRHRVPRAAAPRRGRAGAPRRRQRGSRRSPESPSGANPVLILATAYSRSRPL